MVELMDSDFDGAVQKQLDAAMPWVGLYIAAASAVCTLAIAADAVNSLRQKKLWFPCKYSSLNAASLTVLAVAMKLPMDLNTVLIKSQTDASAKFGSVFFISTTVSNLMPSLGSMNDKELLANVVGLGILVITITGNVGIQIIELQPFLKRATVIGDIMIPLILMLVSLAILVSLAVTVSSMKSGLILMYQEKHKAALEEEEEAFKKMDDQRRHMMKYWVMAESSNPQFVMARSVVSTTSAFICCLSYLITASIHILGGTSVHGPGESLYGIYTKWIVYIQSIGLYIICPLAMMRWFTVVKFRRSTTSLNSLREEFKIEAYWIQTLKSWRDSFSGLQIGPNRWGKYLLDFKWCVLTLCIGLQIFIVLLCKIIVFLSGFMIIPFLFCFSHIKKLVVRQTGHASGSDTDRSLSRYVLLLEGEAELPTSFLRNMCCEADRIIQTGRKRQPSNLVNLLQKSVNFNGVGQFNSRQIPSLVSQDPPDCWRLPLVTLTTIAIALPNISKHKRKQLSSSVSEGLSLAKIVENTWDASAELKNIRKVASVTWVEVLLYSKWLETDLRKAFLSCKNSVEVLQELSSKAEGIVMRFKREVKAPVMENPLNWPLKVVAANSMYRICQTILLTSHRDENEEEMLERLTVMIADILAACLSNLPHTITKMCTRIQLRNGRSVYKKHFCFLEKQIKWLK